MSALGALSPRAAGWGASDRRAARPGRRARRSRRRGARRASARCRPRLQGTPPAPRRNLHCSANPVNTGTPSVRTRPSRVLPHSAATLASRDDRCSDDGQDRCPLQAARPHLPGVRDLRRDRQHLRLRALRRPAEEQRRERLVEGDDPGARRHRGARLRDHPAPAHVGGLGPPGGLHRPARGLPRVQAPLPRRPPRGGAQRHRAAPGPALRQGALEAARRARGLRPDGSSRVQPDVRDLHRAGQGRGLRRLPAPRDRAGDLPRLQDDARLRTQEAAVRDRPDRQVVPQRDHPGQLHLPHARVRADGDGVLRPAGRGGEVARALDGAADGLVRVARRSTPRSCACARTARTSCRTTARPPATSSTSTRSAGPSSRGSPTAATSTSPSTPSSRARSSSTWTRPRATATCRT